MESGEFGNGDFGAVSVKHEGFYSLTKRSISVGILSIMWSGTYELIELIIM